MACSELLRAEDAASGTARVAWHHGREKKAKALAGSLEAVLRAYEQWEADLILSREAWSGGEAELPTLAEPLWDRLIEIQAMRNDALAGKETT